MTQSDIWMTWGNVEEGDSRAGGGRVRVERQWGGGGGRVMAVGAVERQWGWGWGRL